MKKKQTIITFCIQKYKSTIVEIGKSTHLTHQYITANFCLGPIEFNAVKKGFHISNWQIY